MCKLKPLLERWLRDVDKETSFLNSPDNECYGVSSSTASNSLAQFLNKTNLDYDPNATGSSNSTSPSAIVSTSSMFLIENLGKRRKKRTSIETSTRVALEKAFIKNPKPTSDEIAEIAEQLYMEKEVVSFFP